MASNRSPIPASGQVLANGDLLYDIFTFLPLNLVYDHGHVARCTTVCRAFHEPAVRVLWRHMPALFHLCQLLVPESLRALGPLDCGVELNCISQV